MKKTIREIKEKLSIVSGKEKEAFLTELKRDERKGVKNLILREEKLKENERKEMDRLFLMTKYERKYSSYSYIAGIDEVGRGPLAGPVAAGAVILPEGIIIPGINDSKRLSEKKREELVLVIEREAIAFSVALVGSDEIDEINILNATHKAMLKAVENLDVTPDMLLIDAETIKGSNIPQEAIIKGDAKSVSIAAASIVAKVYRDNLINVSYM